jgi:hypothetical protein
VEMIAQLIGIQRFSSGRINGITGLGIQHVGSFRLEKIVTPGREGVDQCASLLAGAAVLDVAVDDQAVVGGKVVILAYHERWSWFFDQHLMGDPGIGGDDEKGHDTSLVKQRRQPKRQPGNVSD